MPSELMAGCRGDGRDEEHEALARSISHCSLASSAMEGGDVCDVILPAIQAVMAGPVEASDRWASDIFASSKSFKTKGKETKGKGKLTSIQQTLLRNSIAAEKSAKRPTPEDAALAKNDTHQSLQASSLEPPPSVGAPSSSSVSPASNPEGPCLDDSAQPQCSKAQEAAANSTEHAKSEKADVPSSMVGSVLAPTDEESTLSVRQSPDKPEQEKGSEDGWSVMLWRRGGRAIDGEESAALLQPLLAVCQTAAAAPPEISGMGSCLTLALECFKTLLLKGFLSGCLKAEVADEGPASWVLDAVLTAYWGQDNEARADPAGNGEEQLLLLECLASFVIALTLHLHGSAMLRIFRAFLHAQVHSANPVARCFAKAAAAHILSMVVDKGGDRPASSTEDVAGLTPVPLLPWSTPGVPPAHIVATVEHRFRELYEGAELLNCSTALDACKAPGIATVATDATAGEVDQATPHEPLVPAVESLHDACSLGPQMPPQGTVGDVQGRNVEGALGDPAVVAGLAMPDSTQTNSTPRSTYSQKGGKLKLSWKHRLSVINKDHTPEVEGYNRTHSSASAGSSSGVSGASPFSASSANTASTAVFPRSSSSRSTASSGSTGSRGTRKRWSRRRHVESLALPDLLWEEDQAFIATPSSALSGQYSVGSALSPPGLLPELVAVGNIEAFDRMFAARDLGYASGVPVSPAGSDASAERAAYRDDAIVLATALCQIIAGEDLLLAADVTAAAGEVDARAALAARVHAMELLLWILDASGPCLLHSDRFLQAMERGLCPALLEVWSLAHAGAFALAYSVLLRLLLLLRAPLLPALRLLLPHMLVRPLESPASVHPKATWLALHTVACLAERPQTLVELFVNLDCRLGNENVVERTLVALAKLATPKASAAAAQGVPGAAPVPARTFQSCAAALLLKLMDGLKDWAAGIASMSNAASKDGGAASQAASREGGEAYNTASMEGAEASKASLREGQDAAHASPNAKLGKGASDKLAGAAAAAAAAAASTSPLVSKIGSNIARAVLDGAQSSPAEESSKGAALGAASSQVEIECPEDDGEQGLWYPSFETLLKACEPFKAAVALFNSGQTAEGLKGIRAAELLAPGASKSIGASTTEAALLFKYGHCLDPNMVGLMLGERDAESPRSRAKSRGMEGANEGPLLSLVREYLACFDFEGLSVDEALRLLLSRFQLPGEAQKIDRIMEAFAQRYWECCTHGGSELGAALFRGGPATVHVLAFSVIMLHTDAHNPAVRAKMSKADFVRNNRGIDAGGDMPREFLESLYDRIVAEEMVLLRGQTSEVRGPNGASDIVPQSSPGERPSAASLRSGSRHKAQGRPGDLQLAKRTAGWRRTARTGSRSDSLAVVPFGAKAGGRRSIVIRLAPRRTAPSAAVMGCFTGGLGDVALRSPVSPSSQSLGSGSGDEAEESVVEGAKGALSSEIVEEDMLLPFSRLAVSWDSLASASRKLPGSTLTRIESSKALGKVPRSASMRFESSKTPGKIPGSTPGKLEGSKAPGALVRLEANKSMQWQGSAPNLKALEGTALAMEASAGCECQTAGVPWLTQDPQSRTWRRQWAIGTASGMCRDWYFPGATLEPCPVLMHAVGPSIRAYLMAALGPKAALRLASSSAPNHKASHSPSVLAAAQRGVSASQLSRLAFASANGSAAAQSELAVQTLEAVVGFLSQFQLNNSVHGALTLYLDCLNLQHGFHSASRASRTSGALKHLKAQADDPVRRQLDFGDAKAAPRKMRRNWTLSPKVRPSRIGHGL